MKDQSNTSAATDKSTGTSLVDGRDLAKYWSFPSSGFGPSAVRQQIIELLQLRRPKHIRHPND
jgi:hypothetical protein